MSIHRSLASICLAVLTLACGCDREVALAAGDPDGGAGDAAGTDATMTVASDMASGLCSLGNDPLPCASPSDPVCTPYGAFCEKLGAAVSPRCACVTQACTPGSDQTCNSDPAMSSFAGHCNSAGVCECGSNSTKDAMSGKCVVHACPVVAPTAGATCDLEGQSCSYLPNTTCVCLTNSGMVGSMPQWNCAI